MVRPISLYRIRLFCNHQGLLRIERPLRVYTYETELPNTAYDLLLHGTALHIWFILRWRQLLQRGSKHINASSSELSFPGLVSPSMLTDTTNPVLNILSVCHLAHYNSNTFLNTNLCWGVCVFHKAREGTRTNIDRNYSGRIYFIPFVHILVQKSRVLASLNSNNSTIKWNAGIDKQLLSYYCWCVLF